MQYSLLIDQARSVEWGLNLSEAALFCVVSNAPSWATEVILGDKVWYWIANSKLANELPLITNKPDTVKRLMASLQKKGLINRKTDGLRSYIQLTQKGKLWNKKEGGENNPYQGGKNIPTKAGEISPQLDNHLSCNHEPDIVGKPDTASKVIEYLNQRTGSKFRPVKSNLSLINARFNEGHSLDDVIAVIDRKCAEWSNDSKMRQYLRPSTLFNAEKFNTYVGQIGSPIPCSGGAGDHASRHIGFDKKDYTNGLVEQEDGTYVF